MDNALRPALMKVGGIISDSEEGDLEWIRINKKTYLA